VAVEGVRFRVRELQLALPTSRTMPFDGVHLRSRVASAYYAAERRAVGEVQTALSALSNRADPGSPELRAELVDGRSVEERAVSDALIARLVARDRRRSVAAWFDIATDDPLEQLPIGGRTTVRLPATGCAAASASPVLADLVISGTATVVAR